MFVKEFVAFVKERELVRIRKEDHELLKPWTKDVILQSYRFCNIRREDDRVTRWIRNNWREPMSGDQNVWFTMVVARVVNWPDTLYEIPHAVRSGTIKPKVVWKPEVFVRELDARKARGEKVWTGAYMIHADAAPGLSKAAYYAERVLTPLWEARKEAPVGRGYSLHNFHSWLMRFRDMGSFMAAQVVADVKYTPLLSKAPDWENWAAPGPGSLRGMNRVLGRPIKAPHTAWLTSVQELRRQLNAELPSTWEPLHAQDVQNCLCEFDKYMRVKLNEGKPRSLYAGR